MNRHFGLFLPALMAQITLLHSSKYADSDGDKNSYLLNVIVFGRKSIHGPEKCFIFLQVMVKLSVMW